MALARVHTDTHARRYNLWKADFEHYPMNPTIRGSFATETYLNHGQDRDRLLAAMEWVVDSAGMISDAQATTDHVTRIANRLSSLGESKVAVAALDRAIRQNTDIMRVHEADLARGIIRIDPRWTNNRVGYPHVQNCNYLRTKGLCLMIGSGARGGGNAEYPTTADQHAAKMQALAAFEEAVETCKDMRRTESWELCVLVCYFLLLLHLDITRLLAVPWLVRACVRTCTEM